MAAATVLSSQTDIVGRNRRVTAKLDSPANTNTWDSGLYAIDSVLITSCDATALAAADSLSVTAISGGVVTIGVAGTGRDCFIVATGI